VLFGTCILLGLVPAILALMQPPKIIPELDHSGRPIEEYYQQA